MCGDVGTRAYGFRAESHYDAPWTVAVNGTRKKLLTSEEVAERFPKGPDAAQLDMVVRHVRLLDEARDDPDRFHRLVEAFKTARVKCRMLVSVPSPHEPTPKTLPAETRDWMIASVTAFWHELGQFLKRPTMSEYNRWRRGRREYIGRAALDAYAKGHPGYGSDGTPLPRDPDQDWRETRPDGKLEKPLDAVLRVAGLV